MPIAVPTMPDSATGLSKQRSLPNSAWSPSVMRKTPPNRPTSSPYTTTLSSAFIASRSAVLSAAAIVTATSGLLGRRELGLQEVALRLQVRGHGGVHVLEHLARISATC